MVWKVEMTEINLEIGRLCKSINIPFYTSIDNERMPRSKQKDNANQEMHSPQYEAHEERNTEVGHTKSKALGITGPEAPQLSASPSARTCAQGEPPPAMCPEPFYV